MTQATADQPETRARRAASDLQNVLPTLQTVPQPQSGGVRVRPLDAVIRLTEEAKKKSIYDRRVWLEGSLPVTPAAMRMMGGDMDHNLAGYENLIVAGHNWGNEATIVRKRLDEALKTKDPAVAAERFNSARQMADALPDLVSAHKKAVAIGDQRLGEVLVRSAAFLGTDQAHRTEAAINGVNLAVNNPEVYLNPANRQQKDHLLTTLERFSDQTKAPVLSRDDIQNDWSVIQTNFVTASVNVFEQRISQFNIIQNQLQSLASLHLEGGTRKILDDLIEDVKKLIDKLEKREASEEEQSELAKKVRAFEAGVIVPALKALNAPQELLDAIEQGMKFMVPSMTQRGIQLLDLGLLYLQHIDLLSLKVNEKSSKAVIELAKRIATMTDAEYAKLGNAVASNVAGLRRNFEDAKNKVQETLAQRMGFLEEALGKLKSAIAQETGADKNEALRKAMDNLRLAMESMMARLKDPVKALGVKGDEFLNLQRAYEFLGGFLKLTSAIPSDSKESLDQKNAANKLFSNALANLVKEGFNEKTEMLKFLALQYLQSADSGYRKFAEDISGSLADGTLKIEDAKRQIAGRILGLGDSAVAKLREVSPQTADLLGDMLKKLRGQPEKASASDFMTAIQAIGLTNTAVNDIAPVKDDKVRDGAFTIFRRALAALGLDQSDAAAAQTQLARKTAMSPLQAANTELLSKKVERGTLLSRMQMLMTPEEGMAPLSAEDAAKAVVGDVAGKDQIVKDLLADYLEERGKVIAEVKRSKREDFFAASKVPQERRAELSAKLDEIHKKAGLSSDLTFIRKTIREIAGETDFDLVVSLYQKEFDLSSIALASASSRKARDAALFYSVDDTLAGAAKIESNRTTVATGSEARRGLEELKASVIRGDYISEDRFARFKALQRVLFGSREDNQPGILERIRKEKDPKARDSLNDILMFAVKELVRANGDVDVATTILESATAMSKVKDPVIRDLISETLVRRDVGELSNDEFLARMTILNQRSKALAGLDSIEGLRGKAKENAKANISAQFDLAFYLRTQGNAQDSMIVFRMAFQYSIAVRAKAAGGDTSAADGMIAYVHSQLGDFSANKEMASGKRRFTDIKHPTVERREWKPESGSFSGAFTRTVLGSPEEDQEAVKKRRDIRVELARLSRETRLAYANRRIDIIEQSPEKAYTGEAKRLSDQSKADAATATRYSKLADDAEKRKRGKEAARYRGLASQYDERAKAEARAASIVSRKWVDSTADSLRNGLASAFKKIGELEDKALELEARGDMPGAERLASAALSIEDRFITPLGGLETYNSSVMKLNTPAHFRTRGREETQIGVTLLVATLSGMKVDLETLEPSKEELTDADAADQQSTGIRMIRTGGRAIKEEEARQAMRNRNRWRLQKAQKDAEIRLGNADGDQARAALGLPPSQPSQEGTEVLVKAAPGQKQLPVASNIEVEYTQKDGTKAKRRIWDDKQKDAVLRNYRLAQSSNNACDFQGMGSYESRAGSIMQTGQIILNITSMNYDLIEQRARGLGAEGDGNVYVMLPDGKKVKYDVNTKDPIQRAAQDAYLRAFETKDKTRGGMVVYDPNRRMFDRDANVSDILAIQGDLAAGGDVNSNMRSAGRIEKRTQSQFDREMFWIDEGASEFEAQKRDRRANALLSGGTLTGKDAENNRLEADAKAHRAKQQSDLVATQFTVAKLREEAARYREARHRSEEAREGFVDHDTMVRARAQNDEALLAGLREKLESSDDGKRLLAAAAADAQTRGRRLSGDALFAYLEAKNPELLNATIEGITSAGTKIGAADVTWESSAWLHGLRARAARGEANAFADRWEQRVSTLESLIRYGGDGVDRLAVLDRQLGKWRGTSKGVDMLSMGADYAAAWSMANALAAYADDPASFKEVMEGRRKILINPLKVEWGDVNHRRGAWIQDSGISTSVFVLPYFKKINSDSSERETHLLMGGVGLTDFNPVGRFQLFRFVDRDGHERPFEAWNPEEKAGYMKMRGNEEAFYAVSGVRPLTNDERKKLAKDSVDAYVSRYWRREPTSEEYESLLSMAEVKDGIIGYGWTTTTDPNRIRTAVALNEQFRADSSIHFQQAIGVERYRRSFAARWGERILLEGLKAYGENPSWVTMPSVAPGTGPILGLLDLSSSYRNWRTTKVGGYAKAELAEWQKRGEVDTAVMFGTASKSFGSYVSILYNLGTGGTGPEASMRRFETEVGGQRQKISTYVQAGAHQASVLRGVDFIEEMPLYFIPVIGPAYAATTGITGFAETIDNAGGWSNVGRSSEEQAFWKALGMNDSKAEYAVKTQAVAGLILNLLPLGIGRFGSTVDRVLGVSMIVGGVGLGAAGAGGMVDWQRTMNGNTGVSALGRMFTGDVKLKEGVTVFEFGVVGMGGTFMGPLQELGMRALIGPMIGRRQIALEQRAIAGDMAAARALLSPSAGIRALSFMMGGHQDSSVERNNNFAKRFRSLSDHEQTAMARLQIERGGAFDPGRAAEDMGVHTKARERLEGIPSIGKEGVESYRPGNPDHPIYKLASEAAEIIAKAREAGKKPKLTAPQKAAFEFANSDVTRQTFLSSEGERLGNLRGNESVPASDRPLADYAARIAESRARQEGRRPNRYDHEAGAREAAKISLRLAEMKGPLSDPQSPLSKMIESYSKGLGITREEAAFRVAKESVERGPAAEKLQFLDTEAAVRKTTRDRKPPLDAGEIGDIVKAAEKLKGWVLGKETPTTVVERRIYENALDRIARGESPEAVMFQSARGINNLSSKAAQMKALKARIQAEAELRSSPGVRFDASTNRFIVTTDAGDVAFSAHQMSVAHDLVAAAELIKRGEATARALFPKDPLMQRAAEALAAPENKRFNDATDNSQGVDRKGQLLAALEIAGEIPSVIARKYTVSGLSIEGMRGIESQNRADAAKLTDFEKEPVVVPDSIPEDQRAKYVADEKADRTARAKTLLDEADAVGAEIKRRVERAKPVKDAVAAQLEGGLDSKAMSGRAFNEANANLVSERARNLADAFDNETLADKLFKEGKITQEELFFIRNLRTGDLDPSAVGKAIADHSARWEAVDLFSRAFDDAIAKNGLIRDKPAALQVATELARAFLDFFELRRNKGGTLSEADIAGFKALHNFDDSTMKLFAEWSSLPRETVADRIVSEAMRRERAPANKRATPAQIDGVAANAPAAAHALALEAVMRSGRTIVAGSEYSPGLRSTNDAWFSVAGNIARGISVREMGSAADALVAHIVDGKALPPSEGEFFQTNALMGNGNSDERGMVIVSRRARDYNAAAAEARRLIGEETVRTGKPPTKERIAEIVKDVVDKQGSMTEAHVISIDKSGLGDIDRSASWYRDPRINDPERQRVDITAGFDPASVISRELFGDMMHRAGEILAQIAKRTNGKITSEDIRFAMRLVKEEVIDPSMASDSWIKREFTDPDTQKRYAGLLPEVRKGAGWIPEEHIGTVAAIRDRIRYFDVLERSRAARHNRGFRPMDGNRERIAISAELKQRLGVEPTEAQIKEFESYLHVPDPRTYNVHVGPDEMVPGNARKISLDRYSAEYLERGREMLAAFAFGSTSERVTPLLDPGEMYEASENRQASYTSPIADALGIETRVPQEYKGAVKDARERIKLWEEQEAVNAAREKRPVRAVPDSVSSSLVEEAAKAHGLAAKDVQSWMQKVVTGVNEHGRARLEKSDVLAKGGVTVSVKFKLTADGLRAVDQRVVAEVNRAAGDAALGKEKRIDNLVEEYRVNRPEAERLLQMLDDGKLTTQGFVELVPRKGILFTAGDWGFAAGNTALGHYGMNALAQSVADALAKAEGGMFVEDNLTVILPPGSDPAAFVNSIRQDMAGKGYKGVEVVAKSETLAEDTTVKSYTIRKLAETLDFDLRSAQRDARAKLGANATEEDIADEVRNQMRTFGESITYIVHSTHPSVRGKVYHGLFGSEAEAVVKRYDGKSREERVGLLDTLQGKQREQLLLYSLVEEIKAARSMRKPEEVLKILEQRATEAEGAGRKAEAGYWREIAKELTTFARMEGDRFVMRYHERPVEQIAIVPISEGHAKGFSAISGREGAKTYVIRDLTSNIEIKFTQEHASAASQLMTYAESLIKARSGAKGEEASKREAEALARIPENMRDGASELSKDPTFKRALDAGDVRGQLLAGLHRAGYLPEIAGKPRVREATNATEALFLIEAADHSTPIEELRRYASERKAQADTLEKDAASLENQARILEADRTGGGTRPLSKAARDAIEAYRSKAKSNRELAAALKISSELLEKEAVRREAISNSGPRLLSLVGSGGLLGARAPKAEARPPSPEEFAAQDLATKKQATLGDRESLLLFATEVARGDSASIEMLRRMDSSVFAEVMQLAGNPDFQTVAKIAKKGAAADYLLNAMRAKDPTLISILDESASRIKGDDYAVGATGTYGPSAPPMEAGGMLNSGRGGLSDISAAVSVAAELGGAVSPSRLMRLVSEAGRGAVNPDVQAIQAYRRANPTVSAEEAAHHVLEVKGIGGREDLGTVSRRVYDVAEDLLSSDPARKNRARGQFSALDRPEQEAVLFMVTEGSRYARADKAGRLRLSEGLGRDIELERAGLRPEVPRARLQELAEIAKQVIEGKDINEIFTPEPPPTRLVPPTGAAEMRALSRIGTMMLSSKEAMPVGDYARMYEAEVAPLKVVPSKESRRARQEAAFFNQPFNEEAVIDMLAQQYYNSAIHSPNFDDGAMGLAMARVKRQPSDVQARVKAKVEERVAKLNEAPGHEDALLNFGVVYDALINLEPLSSYRPVFELNPAYTTDQYYEAKESPTERRLKARVIKKAVDDSALLQGVERRKGGTGTRALINIMLEGEIRFGQFGAMAGESGGRLDTNTSLYAAGHGPFYIVVENGTKDVTTTGRAVGENQHIAYIVPDEYKQQIAAAMYDAVSRGKISRADAVNILSKVVSYSEYVAQPPGIMKSSVEFARRRAALGETLLAEGGKRVQADQRIAVEGRAKSLIDNGIQGTEHIAGVFADTFTIGRGDGSKVYPLAQAREASSVGAAAEFVLKRRAAGEAIPDSQVPHILKQLGLPEGSHAAAISLLGNPEYNAAVSRNDGQRMMRLAIESVRETAARGPAKKGPPPLHGVIRIARSEKEGGDIYRHIDLPGKEFTNDQIGLAEKIVKIAEALESKSEIPTGSLPEEIEAAKRVRNADGFSPADKDRSVRYALMQLERLQGDIAFGRSGEALENAIAITKLPKGTADHARALLEGLYGRTKIPQEQIDAINAKINEGKERIQAVFDVAAVLTESERISAMKARPNDPLDAFAYDCANTNARLNNRQAPAPEDFFAGAAARSELLARSKAFDLTGNNGSISTTYTIGERPHIDIHFTAADGRTQYRIRVYADDIRIAGAGADWLGEAGREVLGAYAEKRMATQLAALRGTIGPLMEQVAKGNMAEAARMANDYSRTKKVEAAAFNESQTTEIANALVTPHDPRMNEAMTSFFRLSDEKKAAVMGQIRQWAEHLRAASDPVNASRYQLQATSLGELMALNGPIGQHLEYRFGLAPGELTNRYISADTVENARKAVCNALNLTISNYTEGHMFGMVVSGNLLGVVRDLYPAGNRFDIQDIGGGATGAYKVTVMDNSGRVLKTLGIDFVKKVDMRADAAGAQNYRISSVASPETIVTDRNNNPLRYLRPDGTISSYGITMNIGNFDGTLRMAGIDIGLKAERVSNFYEMLNSPEITDIFINHPDVFYSMLGYTMAGTWAAGGIDGHAGNSYGMIATIKNPTPEMIAKLEAAGYKVFTDPMGNKKMFLVGRIDTDDAAGTYWAVGEKGNFNFNSLRHWMGEQHVFPQLFKVLTYNMNANEQFRAQSYRRYEIPAASVQGYENQGWKVSEFAGKHYIETEDPAAYVTLHGLGLAMDPAYSAGRQPHYISVREVMQRAFGMSGDGPIYEGIRRWCDEHVNDSQYKDAMRASLRAHEGEPAGVSAFRLDDAARRSQLASDGVTYHLNTPYNGEGATPVFFDDGRTVAMADREIIGNVSSWSAPVQALFPHNRRVFVVPVTPVEAAAMSGTFSVGGKWFAVYPTMDAVPPNLKPRALYATRLHDNIRAAPGFGDMTGLPTKKVGSVHVFDYIMDRGVGGMVSEFFQIQRAADLTERRAEDVLIGHDAAAKKRFAEERMPVGVHSDQFFTRLP